MPSCRINQLPLELLVQIFDYVQQPSSSSTTPKSPTTDPSITSCLLCCTKWHELALPMLYRDIVLGNQNFVPFTRWRLSQPPPEKYPDVLKLVRSLTVSLNARTLVDLPAGRPLLETDEKENAQIKELLLPLERLPVDLAQMTSLTTFSLSITLYGSINPNPATIGQLLQCLPKTCVNLELDLDRYYNSKGTGVNHVCQEIARCLPRLHHLRLNINTLCPDILGRGFSRAGFIEDDAQFHAPTYPSLKTLAINCGFKGKALTCREDRSQSYRSDSSHPETRIALVRSLRGLFLRGSFPSIERLWVLDGQIPIDLDSRESAAWNRRDVARNKTWAIPWTTLPNNRRRFLPVLLTRLPDGQEFMVADHKAMAVLVESQTWRETITGARLPAAILDGLEKGKHFIKGPPTISLSEYRKISPNGSSTWWRHDAMTGTTMVSAIEREGLMDRSPVLATTPPGWTWELDFEGIPAGLVRETGVA